MIVSDHRDVDVYCKQSRYCDITYKCVLSTFKMVAHIVEELNLENKPKLLRQVNCVNKSY